MAEKVKTDIKECEAYAKAKYIKSSPFKLRRIADVVRGKSVEEAGFILKNMPQKSAALLKKVIDSAANNLLVNNKNEKPAYISNIVINEGPRSKRFQPRARGRMYQIIKRSSHIYVGVDPIGGEK